MFGSKSFTLVELVVTIGIVVMVASFVIPKLGDSRGKRSLERTAIELRNKLLEAQALALAPRVTDTKLIGYGFVINIDSGSYGIVLIATSPRTVVSQIEGSSVMIESAKLPASTRFGEPNFSHNGLGTHQIDFLAGERASAEAITQAGPLKTGTLRIPVSQGTVSKIIVVQLQSGSITIE